MATAIRVSMTQRPGMEKLETTFSCEAIVDDPRDAYAQGAEVFHLIEAFETGLKEAAEES